MAVGDALKIERLAGTSESALPRGLKLAHHIRIRRARRRARIKPQLSHNFPQSLPVMDPDISSASLLATSQPQSAPDKVPASQLRRRFGPHELA